MLSIVIPAYNEEKYLGACLEALTKQTVKEPFEVIVVDNASTDRTADVAKSFEGRLNLRAIREEKKGLGWARQAGFTAARYELVANIDADTVLPRGWSTVVFKAFAEDPHLIALSGPAFYPELPWYQRIAVTSFYHTGKIFWHLHHLLMGRGAFVQGGNFIVRKSALAKIGGFNTDINFYGEDVAIAQKLEKIGRVHFTFDLPIQTSARRFAAEGFVRTGLRYALNFFWMTYFGKPFTGQHRDIR